MEQVIQSHEEELRSHIFCKCQNAWQVVSTRERDHVLMLGGWPHRKTQIEGQFISIETLEYNHQSLSMRVLA